MGGGERMMERETCLSTKEEEEKVGEGEGVLSGEREVKEEL